jgi:hypothetical protein
MWPHWRATGGEYNEIIIGQSAERFQAFISLFSLERTRKLGVLEMIVVEQGTPPARSMTSVTLPKREQKTSVIQDQKSQHGCHDMASLLLIKISRVSESSITRHTYSTMRYDIWSLRRSVKRLESTNDDKSLFHDSNFCKTSFRYLSILWEERGGRARTQKRTEKQFNEGLPCCHFSSSNEFHVQAVLGNRIPGIPILQTICNQFHRPIV